MNEQRAIRLAGEVERAQLGLLARCCVGGLYHQDGLVLSVGVLLDLNAREWFAPNNIFRDYPSTTMVLWDTFVLLAERGGAEYGCRREGASFSHSRNRLLVLRAALRTMHNWDASNPSPHLTGTFGSRALWTLATWLVPRFGQPFDVQLVLRAADRLDGLCREMRR